MSRRVTRPEIGTVMYFVSEHLYRIKDNPCSIREYVVLNGKVTGFFEGGYTEVCMLGKNANGFNAPHYAALRDIGKRVFYTAKEAALYAQELTEKYERAWSWMGDPYIPLRRTWEKYIKENAEDEPKISG